jgi:hypothetical protein
VTLASVNYFFAFDPVPIATAKFCGRRRRRFRDWGAVGISLDSVFGTAFCDIALAPNHTHIRNVQRCAPPNLLIVHGNGCRHAHPAFHGLQRARGVGRRWSDVMAYTVRRTVAKQDASHLNYLSAVRYRLVPYGY